MEKFTILEIENDRLKRELEELEEKNTIAQLENAVNMKDGLIEELKNEKGAENNNFRVRRSASADANHHSCISRCQSDH